MGIANFIKIRNEYKINKLPFDYGFKNTKKYRRVHYYTVGIYGFWNSRKSSIKRKNYKTNKTRWE